MPANGASIAVAFEGATVLATATCYDWRDTSVSVGSSGRIKLGDSLQVGPIASRVLTVDGISADGLTLSLIAQGASPIVLIPGDRLVPVSGTPVIFADAAGLIPNGTGNVVTLDARGYARFYCPEARVDYLASGGGLPAMLAFQDVIAGWDSGGSGFINARAYPTLQEAIDATPSGGRIFVPAGTYLAPSGGFVINKALELFGDSAANTLLQPATANANSPSQPVLKIDASAQSIGQIYLHDFSVRNGSSTARLGGSHGITCVTPAAHQVSQLRIERVLAVAVGDDGFHLEGHDTGSGAIARVYIEACEAIECWGSGFNVANTKVAEFHNCYANANRLLGAFCANSQVAWFSSAFENNCLDPNEEYIKAGSSGAKDYTEALAAQLKMVSCAPARIESCDFENFGDGGTTGTPATRLVKRAVYYQDCSGGLVANTNFFNPTKGTSGGPATTGIGIYVHNDPDISGVPQGGWVTVLTNSFKNVASAVVLADGVRSTTVHPQKLTTDSGVPAGTSALSGVMGLAVLARPNSEMQPAPPLAAVGQLFFDTSSSTLKCFNGAGWKIIQWT